MERKIMEKKLVITIEENNIVVNSNHNMNFIELLGVANFLEYWTRLGYIKFDKEIEIEEKENEYNESN